MGYLAAIMDVTERNALVVEHLWVVSYVISKHVPPRMRSDDATQNGALALIHAANKYDPARGVQFGTFAYCVVRNSFRKKPNLQSRIDWEIYGTTGYGLHLECEAPEPEDWWLSDVDMEVVTGAAHAALESLSDKHRTVIEMRCLGSSLKEIGGVLGITKEAVRQLQKTATKRMLEAADPRLRASFGWDDQP